MIKHVRVYISINTPSYRATNAAYPHFSNDADREAFYAKAFGALSLAGYEQEPNNSTYARSVSTGSRLHIHPDTIAGVVPKSEVALLEQAISDGGLNLFGDTRVSCEIHQGSADQIIDALNAKRDEIKYQLVHAAKTKNKNNFKHIAALETAVCQAMGGKPIYYALPDIDLDKINLDHPRIPLFTSQELLQWAVCLINSLVEQGIMTVVKHDENGTVPLNNLNEAPLNAIYLRTLGKTEAKASSRSWMAWKEYFEPQQEAQATDLLSA